MAQSKKAKLQEFDPVFLSFTTKEELKLDLHAAVTALKLGLSQMNLSVLQISETNSRSSVGFPRAFCDTKMFSSDTEVQDSKAVSFIAGDIFVDGLDVLEKYLDDKQPKVPANVYQQQALAKLLKFISEKNHGALFEEWKYFGEHAAILAQHLLSELAVDSNFTIRTFSSLTSQGDSPVCPCSEKDQLIGSLDDTSFGCKKGWHGETDIIMEGVHVFLTNDDSEDEGSEDIPEGPVAEKEREQLLAKTIVFSFLQRKRNEQMLKNYLIPGIGVSPVNHLTFIFYDSEYDVLLASKPLNLFSGKRTLTVSVVLLLWLTLNYMHFSSGITDEMKEFKADFFRRVDDHLYIYQQEVTRPLGELDDIIEDDDHSWANNPGVRCQTRTPCASYFPLQQN